MNCDKAVSHGLEYLMKAISKKSILIICALALAACMAILPACGNSGSGGGAQEAKAVTFGEEKDAVYTVEVQNATGKTIKSLSVKSPTTDQYVDLAISSSDGWATGTSAKIFLPKIEVAVDESVSSYVDTKTVEDLMKELYDVKFNADGTDYSLHVVDPVLMQNLRVCLDQGSNVAYLEFTTQGSSNVESTLDAEKLIAEAIKAGNMIESVTQIIEQQYGKQ